MRRRRRGILPPLRRGQPLPPSSPGPAAWHVEEFASWDTFVNYVTTKGKYPALHDHSASTPSSPSWDLDTGWGEAVKLAREGWEDGTHALVQLSAKLTDSIASRIERFDPYYHLEAGGNLDIARYLDGEPECWLKLESVVTEGQGLKHITVVYANVGSASISAETMLARGAATASLIECLEFAGHRVRLVSAIPVEERGHQSLGLITIKTFDQPMDTARLTYAIAHPAAFRRLGFAWIERLPVEHQRELGEWYGMPAMDIPQAYKGDIYLGPMVGGERDWNTPGVAEAWVIEQLKAQGIDLADTIEER